MTGYVRNDVTDQIANGNQIDAVPLDGEFNAIEGAFAAVGGHSHGGGAGEGAPITKLGPAQDVTISISAILPKTDNTVDLGSSTYEWKNLYVDGVANIDSLVADTVNINGGTIDGTVIGEITPTAITGTTVVATSLIATNAAVGGATVTTASNTQTLTNKTINLSSNSLVATSAQIASAVTDETGSGSLVFSASPALTGVPTAPTAAAGTNTTQLATTAHVFAERTNIATLTNKTLLSPSITGATIVGGSITGITDLSVADGGTGASTAAGALINFGLTATASELNILDGATVTVTEINYLDGVTANLQTQLDGKQPLDTTLTALAGLDDGTPGIVSLVGTNTFAKRTLTGTTDQITVTNGNAVSGNPTISAVVASQAEAIAGTNTTKLMTPEKTKQALNASGSAPIFGARAWVNFDGLTGTIRSSGNIASVVRNGVGDYTITFTTAMPNANYAVIGSGTGVVNHPITAVALMQSVSPSTTTFRVTVGITGGSGAFGDYRDVDTVSIVVFG